ncbi:glutamine--tRNA ligase-like isoform X1 [Zophobas morio]|uniref:glutamine--tRNA ligase-like isoform X1 n=2 Tax=Zophobas morio TaxID=2755281 RepID=UPI003082EDFC
MTGKINTDPQLNAALDYFKTEDQSSGFNFESFDYKVGVGVNVTKEEILESVQKHFKNELETIIEQRYFFNFAKVISKVANDLKWADRKAIVECVDLEKLKLLGPKTESNSLLQAEGRNKESKRKTTVSSTPNSSEPGSFIWSVLSKLHKVGENYNADGYVITPNTTRLLREHVKACEGKYRTRFPPEPNGILHIGHAKAMNLNFGIAKLKGGHCILRYDDTNPEAEDVRFFTEILNMVEWLGHEPWKVSHTSDYFHELYDFAKELTRRGLAYVDHQTAEEIFEERGGENKGPRRESPYRNRPIDENLRLLEEMRKGLWDEGSACLRMKQDMRDGNPQMWDLVAYRVKFVPHPRTGSEWCIYPSYDFAHCLVDSLENITHSLCTAEFQQSRISYYWLCNALDVYCPVQWEFSRLEIANAVLSKRKILKLIEKAIVTGWSDPRLHTLPALKRRGYPPEAINDFCERVGVTTATSTVDNSLLEACVRNYLNEHAPRTMAVLNPLKVTLINYSQGVIEVEAPDFPTRANTTKHKLRFDGVFYIERDDFREKLEKDYKRLTLEQPVGLSHIGYVITVADIIRDPEGNILELKVTYSPRESTVRKVKAFIHWVSDPAEAEVRWYYPLLKERKGEKTTDFLDLVNPNSLKIYPEALIDKGIMNASVGERFQFERIGYFSVDADSSSSRLVFNLTVTLREDKGKKYNKNL